MDSPQSFLVLADGTVFEGRAFGARTEVTGEVVFATNMTGFQETLTDPGYLGQLVCQTFPTVGAAGVNSFDGESDIVAPAGYIVREWCQHPSNFRCEQNLDEYLKSHGVPGICGLDTRALTRHLRRHGAMMGVLLPRLPADLEGLLHQLRDGPIRFVPHDKGSPRVTHAEGEQRHRVMFYDAGAKNSLVRALTQRGCEVVRVDGDTPAGQAAVPDIDGIVWAGGPGDPREVYGGGEPLRALATLQKPLLAVGLGHQQLALAMGAQLEKLPHGHHGGQPVTSATRHTFPTSQNTLYTIREDSLPPGAQVTLRGMADGAVEGVRYEGLPAVSVQFYPAEDAQGAAAGPLDEFLALMQSSKN